MKSILRGISLFYGVQFVLLAVGITIYYGFSEQPFGENLSKSIPDQKLMMITFGALPQGGMGLLLIWFGMTPEFKRNLLRTIKDVIQWLATH
tara:strand:- start:357 stop:632 length:276 start_codon:yes stop_codon:yes gene_type:complete